MTKAEIQTAQLSRVTASFQRYLYEDENSPQYVRASIIDTLEFIVESKHCEGNESFLFMLFNLHRTMEAIESEHVFNWKVLEKPQQEFEATMKARGLA